MSECHKNPSDLISPLLQAFLTFGVVLLGSLIFSPRFQDKYAASQSTLLQILLVFGVPLVTSLWLKLDKEEVFSLRSTSFGNLSFSVLIGLSMTILLEEMGYLQWRVIGLASNRETSIGRLLQAGGFIELGAVFFSFALIPAFCEEFLFRGFIFNRFKQPNQIAEAVMLSSVLFGVFHRDMQGLFNNMVAGVILSVIMLRSGSLYNSIIAHTVTNSVAIVAVNSDTMQSVFQIDRREHLPWVFLVMSGAGLIFGIWGLRFQKNSDRNKLSSQF